MTSDILPTSTALEWMDRHVDDRLRNEDCYVKVRPVISLVPQLQPDAKIHPFILYKNLTNICVLTCLLHHNSAYCKPENYFGMNMLYTEFTYSFDHCSLC